MTPSKSKPFSIHIFLPGGIHIVQKTNWTGLTGALAAAGFPAELDNTADHPGRLAANLCNLGRSGRGCQLEISNGLRRKLFAGRKRKQRDHPTERFHKFVAAVRAVLLEKNA